MIGCITLKLARQSSNLSCRVRAFATGTRGARGHGWFHKYRSGLGGRHLQGEYHDRETLEECRAWNQAILDLGSTRVFMDIVLEPKTGPNDPDKRRFDVPPLDSLTGESKRIEMDLSTKITPETTENFLQLIDSCFQGTRLYRIEKEIGICGGDYLTNSGRTGQSPQGNPFQRDVQDPLVFWHIPGTVSMLVSKVGSVDSRFILCSQTAQHLDGMGRGFGSLTNESMEIVRKWQTTLLTRNGVPTAFDLVVADCGIVETDTSNEHVAADPEPTTTKRVEAAAN